MSAPVFSQKMSSLLEKENNLKPQRSGGNNLHQTSKKEPKLKCTNERNCSKAAEETRNGPLQHATSKRHLDTSFSWTHFCEDDPIPELKGTQLS